jgi:hypothetical protein
MAIFAVETFAVSRPDGSYLKCQQPRDKILRAKLMPRFSGRQNLHSAHTIPIHRERFEMRILLAELSEIFMAFYFATAPSQ